MRSDTIVLLEDLIEGQPFHGIFEVLHFTEVCCHSILELPKRELEGVPHVSFTLDDITLAPEPFGVVASLLEGARGKQVRQPARETRHFFTGGERLPGLPDGERVH